MEPDRSASTAGDDRGGLAAMGGILAFSPIDEAIDAFARGEILVVVDDPGRENEGDFVMAAEWVTPDAVNFMVTHGRGLLCLSMTGDRVDALDLSQMVPSNEPGATAFTVSIDLREPTNTGISAFDRARCIRRAISEDARPEEFQKPGHVFPLRARPGGVLERPGHTEAAVDLARLAGLRAAGVICEIMNPDGSMARQEDLAWVARRHGLRIITIADLIAYRLRHEAHVSRLSEARIPTSSGDFTAVCYGSDLDSLEHVALVKGTPQGGRDVLVRVHSECLTGDAFGSLRCDCGDQLRQSLEAIAEAGEGVVVYLRGHEGRGIGLSHKFRAYNLQDGGIDTVEANERLGFAPDARTYTTAAHILRDLGIESIRLLTNNPAKVAGLEMSGIEVTERVPLQTTPNPESLRYLQAKRDKLDHALLGLERFELMA
jgi:3,4-dihydroxy 2-butanone 4-phosphate synthase/GTP cyclohydrolase II